MTGHSTEGHAAECKSLAGAGWLRLALVATVAVAALSVVTDAADARSLRRNSDQRQAVKKALPAAKGQLLIAVSLGSQRLTVYDDGVPIAHSPVSSGTVGHSTPTGVFSIIQKNRHHRSNIYSGAPMPFMQRITWSGVALHAGVVPGYPASHGCIRLPPDFAARLWGMTRLGARVIVTRDDVTPVAISHARLTLLQTPVMATADKHADLLRPGIGIDEPVRSAAATPVRIADATAGAVASDVSVTPVPPPSLEAPDAVVPSVASPAAAAAPLPSSQTTQTSEEAVSSASPTGGEAADATAVPATAAESADKPSTPATAASTATEPPPASEEAHKAAAAPAEAAPETTSAIDLALPSAVPAAVMPASAPAATDNVVSPADAALPAAEPTTLAALPLDEVFVPPERPARPLRTGPVSVFISRKDGRLYVRKRFDPLFSVPVVIKADQPIGTHVYTAAEGEGGVGLRWIAASLPAELPKAGRNTHMDTRKPDRRLGATAGTARAMADIGRGKVIAMPAMLPPSTATEALDRVDLPAEVVAQIAGLMSPGASIIISDQGLGHETGLETDFIVLSR